MAIKDQLWVAKYAPEGIESTILPDAIKEKFTEWVKRKELPNIGLFGPPGTGKTTSGRAILQDMGVDMKNDVMFVNASDVNSVDAVRNIIKPFAMSASFNEKIPLRFIFLDESDHLSPQAQAALRNLIEASYNSARFILTANYPKKITDALHSRLQTFTLERPDINSVAERIVTILTEEKVHVKDEDALLSLIENNSKDIRKLIQLLQQATVEDEKGKKYLNTAIAVNEEESVFEEYVELLFKADSPKLRKLVFSKFTDTDCDSFWDLMTEAVISNPKKFEAVGAGIDNIIYQLGQYQYLHAFAANKVTNILSFTEIILMD